MVSRVRGGSPVQLEDTLYPFLEPELTLEEKQELKLKITDFKLAGLGKAGENCGKIVMTDIDIGEEEDDIRAVKFKPLRCSRIECPSCYYEWAIRQAFNIALKIEALAEIRNERPFHVIFSIHPLQCYGMTWTDINQKIWRRGRRRLTYIRCSKAQEFDISKIGEWDHNVEDCPNCLDLDVDQFGAEGIFHPFRIRRKWVERLGGRRNDEFDGNAKIWKKIRERLLNGQGKLEDYVKIGYHAHNILFTDFPEKQTNEEYVIKFAGNFERLSRKKVIALVRYLVTHTATIEETAIYRNHICEYCGHSYRTNQYRCGHCGRHEIEETHVKRNRIVHPIRSYGLLHDFNPKEALIKHFGREEGLKIYHRLAHEIANLLILRTEKGEKVTMQWNEELEELEYPAYAEEFITTDEKANWISIWKLLDLEKDWGFMEGLPPEKREFLEDLTDYLRSEGKPPPLEECSRDFSAGGIYIPESVSARIPKTKEPDLEIGELAEENAGAKYMVSDLSREIVRLIRSGVSDHDFLRSHFPSVSTYRFLGVLGKLVEEGTVIQQPNGELVLGV